MKNSYGLTDSLTSVIGNPAACEDCGATTRLGNGICAGCLMREGLEAEGQGSPEIFESVMGEVDVPDQQWRLGNYEILEEVGRGGMGVIYRARQRHSRRIVALKRLLSYHADSRETLVRFRREAEAVASLDHPNILPIHEVGESEDGLPYFSMKFATGGSLQQVGPVLRTEPRECVRLMAKVTRAIAYAHSQGILHRDLKPGNILLDGRGEPLVSDFGLAKWLDADRDLTRSLTTLGTPGYIAPEQSEGAATDLTPAADVYSLGALLFDLLTGRPPFLGAHALSVIRQAAETPAPKLRSLARSLDRDLETICARCLERDPKARYQSAGGLAIDLEHWLAGRPIIARPVSAPARLWRWSRRNPKLVATGVACLLLGAAAIWLFREELIGAPERSLAVLPFENVGQEEKNIVFTGMIQDDISSDLSKVAQLKVIVGTGVEQQKPSPRSNLREITRKLGVRNVLEGSVRRAHGRVEVSVELKNAKGDEVWAKRYNGDVAQSLAIPGDVTKAIANQLHAILSPAEASALKDHPTALDKSLILCQQSELEYRHQAKPQPKENLLRQERLLNEAIELYPNCDQAYRALIWVEWNLWQWDIGEKGAAARRRNMAKQALDNAVRVEPDLQDTHTVKSTYYYFFLYDYETAAREWELGHPTADKGNFRLAIIDRRRGLWADSIRRFGEYEQRNPNTEWGARETGRTLAMVRRYSEAETLLQRALTKIPEGAHEYYRQLSECRLAQGDATSAQEFERQIQSNSGTDELDALAKITTALCMRDFTAANTLVASAPLNLVDSTVTSDPTPGLRLWFEAQIARAQRGAEQARETFARARREAEILWADHDEVPVQHSLLACMDAAAGRKEQAIREAKRALEMRPIAKDALDGSYLASNLALVYAWTGERNLAMDVLEMLAKIPAGPSYGDLKLNPKWDKLRGDPRFEQMVASLAPKL